MPLNREISEASTFTEEAVTFWGRAGNLFCTAKPRLLGNYFICVSVCCAPACSVQQCCMQRLRYKSPRGSR